MPEPRAWERFLQLFKKDRQATTVVDERRKKSSLACGLKRRKSTTIDQTKKEPKKKNMKNPKVLGTVTFEKGGQAKMWDHILKERVLGSDLTLKAAICTSTKKQYKLCAFTPAEFTPSREQVECVNSIFDMFFGDKQTISKKFSVAEDEFEVAKFDANNFLIGVRGTSLDPLHSQHTSTSTAGSHFIGFRTNVVIVLSIVETSKLEAAIEMLKDLRDYIMNL